MEKIMLITGGSQGIGAATAHAAAKKGYYVCVNYHQNHHAAIEVVKEYKRNAERQWPSRQMCQKKMK